MEKVLTILLAGGAGERLAPLTREHAKPMMPFGGIYRLIDVTLSNCVNSGLARIYILTQHKALSLNRHIREAWNILSPELGQFIEAIPPTRRLRDTWYLGTADAVYQNTQSIESEGLPFVLIVSADHIYKTNYSHMLDWHMGHAADVTLATAEVCPEEADRFGIVEMDADFRVCGFEEKPSHGHPCPSRFNPKTCSASMGVYLFSTPVLLDVLRADAEDPGSSHDFGHDVLPRLIPHARVVGYNFVDENKKEMNYWRDAGTLDTYYEVNMDLVAVSPVFNLYDQAWPLRSAHPRLPPAKFVFAEEGRRMGVALDTLVSNGCIVSGGRVTRSVLSPGVRINSHAAVESSVLFPGVQVGRYSKIQHAIVDQNLALPEHTEIGLDPAADRAAGHVVTESGLVIVHKGSPGVAVVPPQGSTQASALLSQSRDHQG